MLRKLKEFINQHVSFSGGLEVHTHRLSVLCKQCRNFSLGHWHMLSCTTYSFRACLEFPVVILSYVPGPSSRAKMSPTCSAQMVARSWFVCVLWRWKGGISPEDGARVLGTGWMCCRSCLVFLILPPRSRSLLAVSP